VCAALCYVVFLHNKLIDLLHLQPLSEVVGERFDHEKSITN